MKFKKEKRQLSDLEKIASKMGDDWEEKLSELQGSDDEGLNKGIAQATQNIHDAKLEMEANPNYQRASEDKKHFSEGFKGVKKRQNAIIKTCLMLRTDRGVT